MGSDAGFCDLPDGGSTALDEDAIGPTGGSPGNAEDGGILVFDCQFCESPDSGSRALEEGVMDSAGKSPGIAESEDSFELKGVSDGGSPLFFADAAELSGRRPGSAEAITEGWVGITFPGSSVFAGAATGSLGKDAGLAALEDGVARSGMVIGSAGVGTGVGVGDTSVVGTRAAAGVNAIGGSKRAKVVNAN